MIGRELSLLAYLPNMAAHRSARAAKHKIEELGTGLMAEAGPLAAAGSERQGLVEIATTRPPPFNLRQNLSHGQGAPCVQA
jgi:hypothetical protein